MDSIFIGNWRRAIFGDRSSVGLIGEKVSPVPLIGSLRRKSKVTSTVSRRAIFRLGGRNEKIVPA